MPLSTIFQLYRESILLVEETGVPGENYRPVACYIEYISPSADFELTTVVVIDTDFLIVIKMCAHFTGKGLSWSWSHGSWIYNYLSHRWLSPLMLWVRTPLLQGVQHCMIKFVSDLRQVAGFLQILRFPSPTKLDCYDITEIFF